MDKIKLLACVKCEKVNCTECKVPQKAREIRKEIEEEVIEKYKKLQS